MRNFFRKRRNPQFGEAGSGENVRPDLDPRVTPFGPRLVSDLGDPTMTIRIWAATTVANSPII